MDAPTARRVSYADHARRAAAGAIPDSPGESARVAVEATRLAPLQAIQVAFDQLHSVQAARLRGEPWPHSASYAQHYDDVMKHARRHAATLVVAADAARSMLDDMSDQLKQIEDHMADSEDPNLTPDGDPHPLKAGGYDPDADPQLPSNISDIEALKEGKTTRRQSEAIAKADAAEAQEEAKADADAKAKAPAKPAILTPSQPQPKAAPTPPPPPPSKPDRR